MDALSQTPSPPDGSPRPTRPPIDLLVVGLTASAAATVAVTFAPWPHSGSASRNSYQLLASAERLGIVEGTVQGVLAAAWPLVPLAVALGGVALALRRRLLAAGLVLAAASLEVVGAVIVLRADTGLRWGPRAALVVGAITVLLAVAFAAKTRAGSGADHPLGSATRRR